MITPCLWFQGDLDAALERYRSVFDDFELYSHDSMGPDVQLAEWRMHGSHFRAISQKSEFAFNESVSLSVTCDDQAEADRYWDALVADGGEESQCGWLKDPFGLSWQIVPQQLYALLSDPDPRRAQAAQQTMMGQQRIVVADLEAAADAASA